MESRCKMRYDGGRGRKTSALLGLNDEGEAWEGIGLKIKVKFDKLYRWDRKREHCSIAVPIRKGQLWSAEKVQVMDGDSVLPSQTKVTSRYEDGSFSVYQVYG